MFSKQSIVTIQILLVCSFQAFADPATQTDWSGGGGIFGPVVEWDSEFYSDTDVDGDGYVDVLGAAYYDDEITWWHVMGFSPAGDIESSILDAGTNDFWDNSASNGNEPTGTSVEFQFRSSDDSANMGARSDTIY